MSVVVTLALTSGASSSAQEIHARICQQFSDVTSAH